MSRQFAHVLMTMSTYLNSLIVLLLPVGVGIMAPHNSASEWTRIFLAVAIFLAASSVVFCFTAEVEPRSWTRKPEQVKGSPEEGVSTATAAAMAAIE